MRVGEGHGGDRALFLVQLGRDVRMRQRMAEARGDRALLVAPLADADAGRNPADRTPAVGACHQPRGEAGAVAQAQHGVAAIELDVGDARRDDRGQDLLRAGIKRIGESGVGDVVAEGGKPELARLELDVRRAQETARRIDDADGLQRRGVAREPLPDTESLQEIDRACEQRRRSRLDRASARCRRWTDRYDLGAHMRQRQRGNEARGAGADHGNIAHGMDFRHLAIAAFDRPEKAKESAKAASLAAPSLMGLCTGCHRSRDQSTTALTRPCGRKATEQSLSSLPTNKEMAPHCQTRPDQ